MSRTSIIVAFCGVIESFSNGDGDSNEEVQKAIGLLSKSTTLQVRHVFFGHFFAVPAQLRRLISFFFEGCQQTTTYFFSLFRNLSAVSTVFNSREIILRLTFSANWIKSYKVYKTRIHFKSDVFAAVAVVDTKAPYLLKNACRSIAETSKLAEQHSLKKWTIL